MRHKARKITYCERKFLSCQKEQGLLILNLDAAAGVKGFLQYTLHSQLIHHWEGDQRCGKVTLSKAFMWENISWLFFISHLFFLIRLNNVISMLSSLLNIGNRSYVINNVYFFHRLRPPNNVFDF